MKKCKGVRRECLLALNEQSDRVSLSKDKLRLHYREFTQSRHNLMSTMGERTMVQGFMEQLEAHVYLESFLQSSL